MAALIAIVAASTALQASDPSPPTPLCNTGVTLSDFLPEFSGNYDFEPFSEYARESTPWPPVASPASAVLKVYDSATIAALGGTDFDPARTDELVNKWLLIQQPSGYETPYRCGRFIDRDQSPAATFVPCVVFAVCAKGCPSAPGRNVSGTSPGGISQQDWDASIWPRAGSFSPEWQLHNKTVVQSSAQCCAHRAPGPCAACKAAECHALANGSRERCDANQTGCCFWSANGGFAPGSCECKTDNGPACAA